jgi:hypothetical protein
VSDRFDVEVEQLFRIARELAATAASLDGMPGLLARVEADIGQAGGQTRGALASVRAARLAVTRTRQDLDALGGEVQQRARLLEAGEAVQPTFLDQLGAQAAGALDALAAHLPEPPSLQLDPDGPIMRQARGQTINPLEWGSELAGYEAQSVLAFAPDEVRNAEVTVNIPHFGDQTITATVLVALALDPSNLIGGVPLKGKATALLKRMLPYLEVATREVVERVLAQAGVEAIEELPHAVVQIASRTPVSERVLAQSFHRAAESSSAAELVGGHIDYGAIDDLGRPTGISAVITEAMTGEQLGTDARRALIPPGYQTQEPTLARGHLLGKQLGGSGDVYTNLVTLFQNNANHPTMSGVEAKVRAAVERGQVVQYSVTPIYEGEARLPARIRIRARGTPVDGAGQGLDLDVTIENVPKEK